MTESLIQEKGLGLSIFMAVDDKITSELKHQLSFLFMLKEDLKDLDDRIRSTALFLARSDLQRRHPEVTDWDVQDRPDESTIFGRTAGALMVAGMVRTMSLHGKSGLGGRQADTVKKNIDKVSNENAEHTYLFMLDPWTANLVNETMRPNTVKVASLLDEDLSPVMAPVSDQSGNRPSAPQEPPKPMVEEIITKETFPEDRVIVSPISRTSLRQGFIYIPKERGQKLAPGPIKLFVRKDASLESKCMISDTGGIRIGGGLTKWFKTMGFQQGDELVMGINQVGSLLVLIVRRAAPYKGPSPVVENVKWD